MAAHRTQRRGAVESKSTRHDKFRDAHDGAARWQPILRNLVVFAALRYRGARAALTRPHRDMTSRHDG